MPPKINDEDLQRAAASLRADVPAVAAVKSVESAGEGFLADGRPKILFERHVMYRQLATKFGKDRADDEMAANPALVNTAEGGYKGGTAEHERLDRASKIDRDCALCSASWGSFQIMGYHWQRLGFATLQAFINAMYRSEGAHLDAFVAFIKSDSNLLSSIRTHNWLAFARGYNGKGQVGYDTKLKAAFEKAGGVA